MAELDGLGFVACIGFDFVPVFVEINKIVDCRLGIRMLIAQDAAAWQSPLAP